MLVSESLVRNRTTSVEEIKSMVYFFICGYFFIAGYKRYLIFFLIYILELHLQNI